MPADNISNADVLGNSVALATNVIPQYNKADSTSTDLQTVLDAKLETISASDIPQYNNAAGTADSLQNVLDEN